MTADCYSKAVLGIIAVALVVIADRPSLSDSWLLQVVRPQWAQDHTLRVVDVEGRTPEYPPIKELIRFQ
jgi:hypothetical protein